MGSYPRSATRAWCIRSGGATTAPAERRRSHQAAEGKPAERHRATRGAGASVCSPQPTAWAVSPEGVLVRSVGDLESQYLGTRASGLDAGVLALARTVSPHWTVTRPALPSTPSSAKPIRQASTPRPTGSGPVDTCAPGTDPTSRSRIRVSSPGQRRSTSTGRTQGERADSILTDRDAAGHATDFDDDLHPRDRRGAQCGLFFWARLPLAQRTGRHQPDSDRRVRRCRQRRARDGRGGLDNGGGRQKRRLRKRRSWRGDNSRGGRCDRRGGHHGRSRSTRWRNG